jgi:small subunit ribosomal protein S13
MAYLLHRYVSPQSLITQALQRISGLGLHQSLQLCDELGLSPTMRVAEVNSEDWERLEQLITTYYHTGQDLNRRRTEAIRRLISIGTYRGFRHVAHLPVRGQRTHTNSRSRRRSPRVTSS